MANASPTPRQAEQLKALSSRAGALALALLMLLSACATGGPAGRAVTAHGDSAPLVTVGQSAREEEAVFVALSADFEPVRVNDEELRGALAALVLDMPLRVASSCAPLYVGRNLAFASVPLDGEAWRSELARAYGRFCERRGSPGDCLTLFEDGPQLDAKDKRGIALALAVGPALEARDAELRSMLSSTQLWTTVSIALGAYLTLLVMPEPISKGVAAVLTILVMLGTAALGDTASLLSKGPKLPGFGQAARAVELRTGVRSMDAAAGAERVILSIPEGTLHVVLPANALAMAAPKGGGPSRVRSRGTLLPNGHRAWRSHSGLTKALGPAGKGKEWHHLVEQTPGNLKRFGPEAIHNTENVAALEKPLHDAVSAFYSSIREGITGSDVLTVRQWLGTQSYEAQRQFGLTAIHNIRNGVWK